MKDDECMRILNLIKFSSRFHCDDIWQALRLPHTIDRNRFVDTAELQSARLSNSAAKPLAQQHYLVAGVGFEPTTFRL
jgi:hypothetical protein